MLLAVDIGNTNVTFGLFDGEELKQTFRASTVRTRTSDEYAVLVRQLIDLRGLSSDNVDSAIIASVVPPLTDTLADAVRRACDCESLIVGPGIKTGLPVLYENPKEVGADRIVNAVAAYARHSCGLIVVDFGTATTFDCITPDGEYLGGVICPGITLSLDALLARAAKLSRVEIAAPPKVLGRNTTHALQSGAIFGYASMVDGLVARLREELGFPCKVLATGGLAPLVARHAVSLEEVDPDLTLVGLRILHERNPGGSRGSRGPRGRVR